MITLSKSGSTVTFTFDENSGYLQNGTIDVPVNSLSLITDESDMATFRKSASNDIFISARYEEFGMSKAELEAWYKANMTSSGGGGGGGVTPEEVQTMIDSSISGKADTSAVTESISAATDDMATQTWVGEQGYLTEHQSLSAYSTTEEVNSAITEATSGKASQSDLETISGQVANKQDTLVSGTNIKTINNESILGSGNIDIQGGSSYTAGRGISIANDTISFSLPISAGTGNNSIQEGTDTVASGGISHAEGNSTIASGWFSHAEGYLTSATSEASHAEGQQTKASGYYSHAEGYGTSANGMYSHAEGNATQAKNIAEHASGKFNISNTGSTNADKTLFSVGNGTEDNARHNAFEIRQNGDIYISSGNTDIKLQDNLGGVSESAFTAHTADTTIHVTSSDKSTWSGKQDALVSGTNIKTINNQSLLGSGNIDIQGGGGKAIEAGRGISITTGATADTVSFDLPISADTDGSVNEILVGNNNTIGSDTNKNIVIGDNNTTFGQGSARHYSGATIIGYNNNVGCTGTQNDRNDWSFVIGRRNKVGGGNTYILGVDNNFYDADYYGRKKNYSYVIGRGNTSSLSTDGNNIFVFGAYNKITKSDEFALGEYNASSNDGTTSGNTFFSIGNGTADNARHNAFEIRQNGDIYCNNGTSDVKLQDYIQFKIVQITQAAYDALVTKDSSTIYIIVN